MSTFNLVESPFDPKTAVYNAVVDAGDPWIHEIRKGQVFRILDLEGNQAVDTLFYNTHVTPRSATVPPTPCVLRARSTSPLAPS